MTDNGDSNVKSNNEFDQEDSLFDQLPLLYHSLDINGKILSVNKQWLEIFGYEKEFIIGKSITDILIEEEIELFRKRYEIFKEKGRMTGLIYHFFDINRNILTIKVNGKALYDNNGKFLRSNCLLEDFSQKANIEGKYRYSRYLYKKFFENSPIAVCIFNIDYEIIDINDAMKQYISIGNNTDINFFNLFNSERDLNFIVHRLEMMSSIKNYECQIKGKSVLDLHWIILSIEKITLGTEATFIASLVNIDNRKKIEEKLKNSEQNFKNERNRLQKYFDSSPMILIILDRFSNIILINKNGANLLGYDEKELIGLNWIENFVVEEVKIDTHIMYNRTVSGKRNLLGYHENKIKKRNGEIIDVAWYSALEKNEKDGDTYIIANGENITEKKHTRKLLENSEKKFRILMDQLPVAIISIDQNGIISFFNNYMKLILDIEEEESLLGRNYIDVIGEYDIENELHHELFDKFIKENKNFKIFAMEIKNKNKEINYFDVTGKIIPIDENPLYQLIFQNVTDKKIREMEINKYNLQLEELNEELRSFSFSLSHELKAPIRRIEGFTNALLEDLRIILDDEKIDFIRRIIESTQLMKERINGILMLSKVLKSDFLIVEVNLSNIVEVICNNLKSLNPDRIFEFKIQKNIKEKGDINLIHILLDNLLNNAYKFSSGKSITKIEFGVIKGKINKYFVKDNGIGFEYKSNDKVQQEMIFGMFQRLHKQEDFQGLGIGLATAKRIVHLHKGKIWAESEKGKGTTFYFTLNENL